MDKGDTNPGPSSSLTKFSHESLVSGHAPPPPPRNLRRG